MKLPAAITMPFHTLKTRSTSRSVGTSPARALAAACLCAVFASAAALTLTSSPALADLTPSGDNGSDPTVGTLPSLGNSDYESLDQTVTLRGSYADLRAAVVSANGVGAVEAIDLGDGDYWIRYYGDVMLELDLAALTNLEVSIFTGFEGNGLTYSVGQANGFGEPRQIGVGGDIRLDLLRFKLTGLLDDTLFIAGLHQTGERTMTSLDFRPVDGVVVIRQDI